MNLVSNREKLFVYSGDNLIVHDFVTGEDQSVKVPPPKLPENLTKGQLDVLNKEERTINSLAISTDQQFLALSTENKQVIVFNKDLDVVNNFIVNRTASRVIFTKTGDIIVADRTGDVYLYKSQAKEPILLLGHLSMILDIVLSPCEKYLITGDRDEKIRVSRFPNTYNIECFCLGHTEFVSFLKIINQGQDHVLLSGSGDGTLRFWNYLTGQQLGIVNTNEFITDSALLEGFSKEMDVEKVDVQALPITQLQICQDSNSTIIAVTLYNFSGIQLYKLESNKYSNVTFLKCIESFENPHYFCLNPNLCVFDTSKLFLFEYVNENYEPRLCEKLQSFHKKYKSVYQCFKKDSITVLYKRKFDNVQEYLARKKMRLESK